jgi:hypothetical protein
MRSSPPADDGIPPPCGRSPSGCQAGVDRGRLPEPVSQKSSHTRRRAGCTERKGMVLSVGSTGRGANPYARLRKLVKTSLNRDGDIRRGFSERSSAVLSGVCGDIKRFPNTTVSERAGHGYSLLEMGWTWPKAGHQRGLRSTAMRRSMVVMHPAICPRCL